MSSRAGAAGLGSCRIQLVGQGKPMQHTEVHVWGPQLCKQGLPRAMLVPRMQRKPHPYTAHQCVDADSPDGCALARIICCGQRTQLRLAVLFAVPTAVPMESTCVNMCLLTLQRRLRCCVKHAYLVLNASWLSLERRGKPFAVPCSA